MHVGDSKTKKNLQRKAFPKKNLIALLVSGDKKKKKSTVDGIFKTISISKVIFENLIGFVPAILSVLFTNIIKGMHDYRVEDRGGGGGGGGRGGGGTKGLN